jgi:hypothetical protein
MRTLVSIRFLRISGIVGLTLFSLVPVQLGAQTFEHPPFVPTSADPYLIVVADVNNDGKPDLIYVDGPAYAAHALHILLGKGDGTFSHAPDISLPAGLCCSLTVADVTKDGKADILLSGSNATSVNVAVFVGNGDGTFQAPVVTTFQPALISLYPAFGSPFAVGDINGDGNTDLALLDSQNGYIYFLLGNSAGHFTPSTPVQSSTRDAVYLLDLNGDGHLDILTTDSIGAGFVVYLGKGDGTFGGYTRYGFTTSGGPFLVADVNSDGHPDVFAVEYPGNLGYFPGKADGSFGTFTSLGPSPSSNQLISVNDLNGDGILDLTFLTPGGIGVSLGKSGPTFAAPLTTITGGSTGVYSTLPTHPVLADFNGDGHLDLAMAAEGGIAILLGKGDGTFASVHFYDMGHQVGGAAVAKFSGSNFQDIAVTLPATFPRLLLGDGTGKFTLGPDPNPSYGTQPLNATVLAADFNGDGKPDLNIGNALPNTSYSGTQSVELNQGNGVFGSPIAVQHGSPNIVDLNGDGRADMIFASDQIYVSLGQADGSFRLVTTPLRLAQFSGLFNVGDVNRDGKPDLILNYRDHFEVWFGNGDGTFTYASSTNIQNVVNDVVAVIADLDGDGNGDMVMAPDFNPGSPMGPLAIFYGNGDGTFQQPVYLPVSHRFSQVTAVDVNRDNKLDLVMTDGAGIAVMMNLGARKFDSEVDYIAGRSVSIVNVVDVNGDGYPDIVVANTDGTTVTILLNQPNGTPPGGTTVTGNLSVQPEPSFAGQPFTITLSVAGQTSGAPVPTGSVGFSIDGAFVADTQLVNGATSYTYSANLIPIPHTVTAAYNGDSNYGPRSFAVTHVVQPPTYSTQTILTAAPSTLLASQTVRLKATVGSSPAVSAGVVTFLDGGNAIGSAPINSSQTAYFDTALLAPGAHSLSAKFEGYMQYGFNITTAYVAAIFSPSTSAAATVTVNANQTSVGITASANSATAGTVVTFTAQVASNAGGPFGGVSFFDGNVLLGTISLTANGSTTYSTASLGIGSHSISAAFNANGPYAGSTSSSVTVAITAAAAAAASVMVAVEPQVDAATGNSSLVATVLSAKPLAAGNVIFLDSGTILGTAPVDSPGIARLENTQMSSGAHSLTASFAGTAQFAPSVSPQLNEQWPQSGQGFSMQIAPEQIPNGTAGVAALKISVTPLGDFREAVEFSCASGLPVGYRCEFSPAVLSGTGASSLLILPTMKLAQLRSSPQRGPAIVIGCVFALLLGSWKRRQFSLLLLFAAIAASAALGGCNSSMRSTQTAQTVVLTVQASTASGSQSIIHSGQVAVRIPASKAF